MVSKKTTERARTSEPGQEIEPQKYQNIKEIKHYCELAHGPLHTNTFITAICSPQEELTPASAETRGSRVRARSALQHHYGIDEPQPRH